MKLRKVTAATAAALVLALTATACGGDDDKGDTGSGGGDKIKVGIKFDQPGIGLKEPDGSFSGFDVDVATFVAKQLGYEPDQIEWVETKSADRETALARGDVKFIAASYSINDKRKAKVDFAARTCSPTRTCSSRRTPTSPRARTSTARSSAPSPAPPRRRTSPTRSPRRPN